MIYHKILKTIFHFIETLSVKDTVILYADEYYQKCFLIIADFMTDYKKQTLIISVKSESHCTVCEVSLNE
ncbi:hypothetical protein EMPG_11932 [Blastomyces silverae]|uniref:Uncharacterized protein n=1 Tax=Blastomyces silverae TaxID=2060906 RepID=A0A0H1BPR8_9EURO|nr:hypothetical protein EMPG_11932 [Blastomyces silverae]